MISCYVWPHDRPVGTRELLHVDRPAVGDVRDALRVLDTVYDLLRHRYATFLSERRGNAAFHVDDPACPHGASFQVSFGLPVSYADVVAQLNAAWLKNRERLGEALART